MSTLLCPSFKLKFFTKTFPIRFLSGGKVYTYKAGGTTPQATYVSAAGVVAHTNPIVLDSNGESEVWLGENSYRFDVYDSNDVLQLTIDNVAGANVSSASMSAVSTLADLRAIPANTFSTVYVIGPSGAGYFYKWDATNSGSDNEWSVILPNYAPSVGRWVLQYNGEIDVDFFGGLWTTFGLVGATPITLLVSTAQTIPSGTFDTDPHTSIKVLKGGSINGPYTIRFYGPFEAGDYVVFGSTLAPQFRDVSIPVLNASWFYNFTQAVNACTSFTKTLVVSTSQAITADLTVPTNITLLTKAGGAYLITIAKTLTVAGPFVAGDSYLFTGEGVVTFTGVMPVFNPFWWGAKADGTNDDSTAINLMCRVMEGITNTTVAEFPLSASYYKCVSVIAIGKSNVTFQGRAEGKSPQMTAYLRYAQNGTSDDFFTCEGSYNVIKDLSFFGNDTTGSVVRLKNNYRSRVENCQISNHQANTGIVSGPGYVFVGKGLWLSGDGVTFANGEARITNNTIRACDKGITIEYGTDGYCKDNVVLDCYSYCIGTESTGGGSASGWLFSGNKAYNSTTSLVKLKKVIQLYGCAFTKIISNEWEMTNLDPVSSASECVGLYMKTGGQEGSIVSDNLIYTNTSNGHHILIEMASTNDVLVIHHNYLGAKVGQTNTVGFSVTGSIAGLVNCDSNFVHDCTTSYAVGTEFFKLKRSDIAAEGFTFKKDSLAGAAKLISASTTVADATGNLFGLDVSVNPTDNSALFGYTFDAVRGIVNLVFNTASTYLSRAGQFISAVTGAFGSTGSIFGSYNQVTDARSGGTDAEHNAVGGFIALSGAGALTLGRAFWSLISLGSSTGAVTSFENFEADTPIRTGGSHVITNSYGFRSKAQKTAFVTNGYGFVQEGSDDVNSFAGEVTVSSLFYGSSQTGITASATQTQGQQPLTKNINVVSTVATTNNVVTLPTARAGLTVFIRNNGANTLQVYPATSGNINGGGVNVSDTIAAGASKTYRTADTVNWYT